jgi:hypothetical protein
MTRENWREWTLNSNTIYYSIIFEIRIENTKFINLFRVNQMWKHLYGDWSQIPAKRTNTEPTALLQTPAIRRPHRRRHHSVFCISCYHSGSRQNLISIFPHRTNGPLVRSSVTDIGCYIRCRCFLFWYIAAHSAVLYWKIYWLPRKTFILGNS